MKKRNGMFYLELTANALEIIIAVMLLITVAIKVFEIAVNLFGYSIIIIERDFEGILSIALNLVIGVEFVKMLCKHTPESVIDVLLFAIARLMVVYHDSTIDVLIGVAAIAGLFAAKKYLVNKASEKKQDNNPEE